MKLGSRTCLLLVAVLTLLASPVLALQTEHTDKTPSTPEQSSIQSSPTHHLDASDTDPNLKDPTEPPLEAKISTPNAKASAQATTPSHKTHAASTSINAQTRSTEYTPSLQGHARAIATTDGATVEGHAASSGALTTNANLQSGLNQAPHLSTDTGLAYNDAKPDPHESTPRTQAESHQATTTPPGVSQALADIFSSFALKATPALAFAAVGTVHTRAWLRGVRWILPLTPGMSYYTRLNREDVLKHETRSEIYNLLQAKPGLSMQAISDALDASRSTVRHHVQKLEEQAMIDHTTFGRCRLHYPVGQREKAIQRHVLSDPMRAQIQTLVADKPRSISAIATCLEANPGRVHFHLGKLCEVGLVERRENGSITYRANADASLRILQTEEEP